MRQGKYDDVEKREETFAGSDGDYLDHDCLTIKKYTKENWFAEPWNTGDSKKKFKQNKPGARAGRFKRGVYTKYNSAYGIPMIGTEIFSDESMLRGCYLIRYLFQFQ